MKYLPVADLEVVGQAGPRLDGAEVQVGDLLRVVMLHACRHARVLSSCQDVSDIGNAHHGHAPLRMVSIQFNQGTRRHVQNLGRSISPGGLDDWPG